MGEKTWLDIYSYALELAKKQNTATLKDLRSVNRILKKVQEKESNVVFKRVSNKEYFWCDWSV